MAISKEDFYKLSESQKWEHIHDVVAKHEVSMVRRRMTIVKWIGGLMLFSLLIYINVPVSHPLVEGNLRPLFAFGGAFLFFFGEARSRV